MHVYLHGSTCCTSGCFCLCMFSSSSSSSSSFSLWNFPLCVRALTFITCPLSNLLRLFWLSLFLLLSSLNTLTCFSHCCFLGVRRTDLVKSPLERSLAPRGCTTMDTLDLRMSRSRFYLLLHLLLLLLLAVWPSEEQDLLPTEGEGTEPTASRREENVWSAVRPEVFYGLICEMSRSV